MASAQEELHALQARYDELQRSVEGVAELRVQVADLTAENANLRRLLADAVGHAAA